MNHPIALLILSFLLIKCSSSDSTSNEPDVTTPPNQNITYSNVDLYVTKPDKSALFKLQSTKVPLYTENINFSITVNPETTYQEMDGFGFS